MILKIIFWVCGKINILESAKILHKNYESSLFIKLKMGNLGYSPIFVDFINRQNCNVLANTRELKLLAFKVC